MTGILSPFYNVTFTANGGDVTGSLVFAACATTVTTLCVIGCVGLRIIHSYSQKLLKAQSDVARLQGQLNTQRQELEKEYQAKIVEGQTLRAQAMQKFEEVKVLESQVTAHGQEVGRLARDLNEQIRQAQTITQTLAVVNAIARQNELN
jgi:hypothetical protein